MNSTNCLNSLYVATLVWEICKFWILQTRRREMKTGKLFERYVNFEFYKPWWRLSGIDFVWEICKFWILQTQWLLNYTNKMVWEICKFWILQTEKFIVSKISDVWEICKFWILQTKASESTSVDLFERYVNFEFYKHKLKAETEKLLFERYVNFEFYKLTGEVFDVTAVWEICKFWILQTRRLFNC